MTFVYLLLLASCGTHQTLDPSTPLALGSRIEQRGEVHVEGTVEEVMGRVAAVKLDNSSVFILHTDTQVSIKAGDRIDGRGTLLAPSIVQVQELGVRGAEATTPIRRVHRKQHPGIGFDLHKAPFTMVLVSPSGQILSPAFSEIPAALYEHRVNPDSGPYQRVTIPYAEPGLWALKLVPIDGTDPSQTVVLPLLGDVGSLLNLSSVVHYVEVPASAQEHRLAHLRS